MSEKNNYSTKTNYLLTIKSRIVLKRILSNLKVIKLFLLINYNKKFQNILDINLKDYKEILNIEIEINIAKNEYGKFINMENVKKSHYHIYFDNNKEDIKRNFITRYDNVKKIKIIIESQIKSVNELFKECVCVKSINIIKFNRNLENMSFMFFGCSLLEEINLSKVYTDKAKNMSYMFYNCKYLKRINLKSFYTYNVMNMSNMFY